MQTLKFNSKIHPEPDRSPKTAKVNKVVTRARKYAGKINKALDDARQINQNQKLAASVEQQPDES